MRTASSHRIVRTHRHSISSTLRARKSGCSPSLVLHLLLEQRGRAEHGLERFSECTLQPPTHSSVFLSASIQLHPLIKQTERVCSEIYRALVSYREINTFIQEEFPSAPLYAFEVQPHFALSSDKCAAIISLQTLCLQIVVICSERSHRIFRN